MGEPGLKERLSIPLKGVCSAKGFVWKPRKALNLLIWLKRLPMWRDISIGKVLSGLDFPAAVRHGVAMTAANISKKWIGINVEDLLSQATQCPVKVINDADAAGIAEMHFGAGRGQDGVVLIVTIGTGLGISLFTDSHLLPNAELGHIEINGKDAELICF